jgi:hypothetical protein
MTPHSEMKRWGIDVLRMTRLLERAFAEATKLTEAEQDRIAAALFQELADDAKWKASSTAPASQLDLLADQALKEYRAGRTEELGFDEL